jgi:hypothetical protein
MNYSIDWDGPGERDDDTPMPPGSYGCHEAMHMASFFAASVDKNLADHPAIAQNLEWRLLAQEAVKNLADLYQAIGAKHMESIPEPPTSSV